MAGAGKPGFNWDTPDRNVELLNFQLEVTNIIETRAYEINDEDRILLIKNWLDEEGLLLMKTFTQKERAKCKTTKRTVLGVMQLIQTALSLYYNCTTILKIV